jgi:polyferredoxin
MKALTLPRLRRASQAVFLAAFLTLLFETDFGTGLPGGGVPGAVPRTVSIFLQADPLVSLVTALSTWSLYQGLLWSLVILLPTFVLGRVFCGWVCPLGTMAHLASALKSEKKRGMRLIASNRYKTWHALKYYVLGAGLVAALLGSAVITVLDPIAFAVRSLTASVLPALNFAVNAVLDSAYRTDFEPARGLVDGVDAVLQGTVLSFQQPHFRQGFFLGLLFLAVLAANLRVTRLWCRSLCPLGALLGVASRWSIVGLEKHTGQCEDCNRCLLHCQGGDDPIPGAPWRRSECHLCLNCIADCPSGTLAFTVGRAGSETRTTPEVKRRKLLTGLVAGAGLVPFLRSAAGHAVDSSPRLIRPPGALDEPEFLARCVRCGECMKVCPTNALHPALTDGGLEGLWTPVIVPRIGYCEPNCVLCGQVCPTGAIWELTAAEKMGTATPRDDSSAGPAGSLETGSASGSMVRPVKIGTAFYDRGRCLPWAMATECIVCEEWCPTSPKAITLQTVDVPDSSGAMVRVRQPSVDPKRCTGCGACEFACPVRDQPAVYVTAIGETRSSTNQLILQQVPNRL